MQFYKQIKLYVFKEKLCILYGKLAKSIFYHAGCPVCVSAEHDIVNLIGATNVEIVHIGEDRNRIAEDVGGSAGEDLRPLWQAGGAVSDAAAGGNARIR